ncbi:MAG: TIGR00730 family Rossman fold protein [Lentisphaeria bacterium]|nr:TIGR00730 family Rossman fold protein [Lentisphaeria bacterium]NQZ66690.1 TIGR00730 family Rossman fold protein [Lentisphaeria bacterium]
MNICVYCSSSNLIDKRFIKLAEDTGKLIGQKGHSLIYGGSNLGMMGAVAKHAKAHGAYIKAIIPQYFANLDEPEIDEKIITKCLGDRKEKMVEAADAFIVLPGGLGTLDEFFDTVALKSLNKHQKIVYLLNYENFFSPVVAYLEQLIELKFISQEPEMIYQNCQNLDELAEFL